MFGKFICIPNSHQNKRAKQQARWKWPSRKWTNGIVYWEVCLTCYTFINWFLRRTEFSGPRSVTVGGCFPTLGYRNPAVAPQGGVAVPAVFRTVMLWIWAWLILILAQLICGPGKTGLKFWIVRFLSEQFWSTCHSDAAACCFFLGVVTTRVYGHAHLECCCRSSAEKRIKIQSSRTTGRARCRGHMLWTATFASGASPGPPEVCLFGDRGSQEQQTGWSRPHLWWETLKKRETHRSVKGCWKDDAIVPSNMESSLLRNGR